jgi:histidinol-phosphatase (PHP family)
MTKLYETHCHTPLCKHASGEPEEYGHQAAKVGLAGVIVTCHCPLPDGISLACRMTPEQLPEYIDLVARATEALKNTADVRLGMESDYFPGLENWLEKLHAKADFHYILGSVHYHLKEYLDRFYSGDIVDFQRTYYRHLAEAAETGLYDSLAHPDLVKNQDPKEWDFQRIQSDIARSLDRIAATGVAMELNTSGMNKALREMNPGPVQLRMMAERGIPVVIGADAHEPGRVGDAFLTALDMLEGAGYREVSIFLDRKRIPVSLAAARSSLLA